MNIWDLEIGDAFTLDAGGPVYQVKKDIKEYRPILGRVPVRIVQNLTDATHQKFIHGIKVQKVKEPTP